jgi:hypothetical protein
MLDRALDPVGHHHGPRLPADLVEREVLLEEVVDHDLRLEPDGVIVALDVTPELLPRALGVELRVALHGLDQLGVAVDRRVVAEHVEDGADLGELPDGVAELLVDDAAVGDDDARPSPSLTTMPGHHPHDERLEPLLAGVGRHRACSVK